MSTVFLLGDVYITKDLIFGWTLTKNDNTYLLSDMDVETLTILDEGSYPAYLQDFHEDVRKLLETRKSSASASL